MDAPSQQKALAAPDTTSDVGIPFATSLSVTITLSPVEVNHGNLSQTVTPDIELTPKVRQALMAEFRLYARLQAEIAALEAKKDAAKARITDIREEAGAVTLAIDGYRTTMVSPVRSTLNVKKLFAQGVTPAMIEKATDTVPGKSYEKVTLPSTKGDE